MDLMTAFHIEENKKEVISIVGGGGKTTTMLKLALALKEKGYKVLITTTTAIYVPPKDYYDVLLLWDKNSLKEVKAAKKGDIFVIGRGISPEDKLLALSFDDLEEIYNMDVFDVMLIEADGSKGRPIKAPATHEPNIWSYTTKTVGVIGLDAVNSQLTEAYVHRCKEFAKITGLHIGEPITPQAVTKLVLHISGIFKNTPLNSEKILLLNKADKEHILKAKEIISQLEEKTHSVHIIIAAAMNQQKTVKLWRRYK